MLQQLHCIIFFSFTLYVCIAFSFHIFFSPAILVFFVFFFSSVCCILRLQYLNLCLLMVLQKQNYSSVCTVYNRPSRAVETRQTHLLRRRHALLAYKQTRKCNPPRCGRNLWRNANILLLSVKIYPVLMRFYSVLSRHRRRKKNEQNENGARMRCIDVCGVCVCVCSVQYHTWLFAIKHLHTHAVQCVIFRNHASENIYTFNIDQHYFRVAVQRARE